MLQNVFDLMLKITLKLKTKEEITILTVIALTTYKFLDF